MYVNPQICLHPVVFEGFLCAFFQILQVWLCKILVSGTISCVFSLSKKPCSKQLPKYRKKICTRLNFNQFMFEMPCVGKKHVPQDPIRITQFSENIKAYKHIICFNSGYPNTKCRCFPATEFSWRTSMHNIIAQMFHISLNLWWGLELL